MTQIATESSLTTGFSRDARTLDDELKERQAMRRAERYRFKSLAECKALKIWLEDIGATRRDAIFLALLEHLAGLELREARRAAMARKSRRQGAA
jgi:hypothetical protein